VDANVVQQNQWFLEQKGLLVASTIRGLGRPTEKLIEIYESQQSAQTRSEWVFPPKTQYDAFKTISTILRSAKGDILLVDNFLGEEVLDMLAALPAKPAVKILTHKPTQDFRVAVSKFLNQYGGSIEVRLHGAQIHDRAIVIDDTDFYALGASIKDFGKGLSLINKLEDSTAIATLRSTLAAIWNSASVL
jgi:hypothetical protein